MSDLRRLLRKDWAWALAFGVFLAGAGVVCGPFGVNVALTVMTFMILAVGLNVVLGFTGLLDLGYAAFVAIGGFAMALGLVLTSVPPRSELLPVSKIALSAEQYRLEPAPGRTVVVRERPDLDYDVLSGAESVLAARAAGETALRVELESGVVLPVGQRKKPDGLRPFHFPGGFFLLLVLAGGVCAVAGLVRGWPTLRLVGDYYAIVTLGFAEIVGIVCRNWSSLTGGAFGIPLERTTGTLPHAFGVQLHDGSRVYYFIVLGVLGLAVLAVARLQRSRIGRAWVAIKADETAAMSSGIDVARAKMLAFAVSGFVGGVGGALYAIKLNTVRFDAFDIWLSIQVVCCLVLGGMGTVRGALLGAAIVGGLGELLRYLSDKGFIRSIIDRDAIRWLLERVSDASFEQWVDRLTLPPEARNLFFGLILVLLMRFRPQGLLPPCATGEPPGPGELEGLRKEPGPLYTLGGKA